MFKNILSIKLIVVFGLIFGLFFAAGVKITDMVQHAGSYKDNKKAETEQQLKRQDGERTNILVLGVDTRPGEKEARSDTMLLVSIDPKIDRAAVISIPRDTKVPIKGAGSKICHANVVGGPQYAVKVVEDLLNTDIDYYVKIDFKGFEKIVDTLGGVTVDVPPGMKKLSEGINVPAGKQQLLNGHHALGFVRFRDYPMADIERTQQQQVFIKALAAEVLQPKTIPKLPKLITQLNEYIDTNMGVTDMLKIASWAPGFTVDSIAAQTLPGGFYDELDEYGNLTQSYWLASDKQLTNLIDNMLNGKVVAVVQFSSQPNRAPLKSSAQDDNEEDKTDQKGYINEQDSQNSPAKNSTANENSNSDRSHEVKPPKTDKDTSDIGPEGYM